MCRSRICRPGSVVGPQQQYLLSIEDRMHAEGRAFKLEHPNHPAGHTPAVRYAHPYHSHRTYDARPLSIQ